MANPALNKFDSSLLEGFSEGMTFAALRAARHRGPPAKRGVYAVVYPFETDPKFLAKGSGGRFKGRDPNIAVDELEERWVPGTRLLYFGKAGAPGDNGNLHERISLYSKFGRGRNVSHSGGRYIWQIDRSEHLLVRWRPEPEGVPRKVEARLIREFVTKYCAMPFANLVS